MKPNSIAAGTVALIAIAVLPLSAAFGQDRPATSTSSLKGLNSSLARSSLKGLEFRDAATHDQLSQKLRTTSQTSPMSHLGKRDLQEDEKIETAPSSFAEDSDFLSYNGNVTLVPKGAILNLPEKFSNRMKLDEKAKILTFSEFSVLNRGWVTTLELDIETAFGKKPFDPKKVEWMKNSGRLIIATYQGGAISVLPYTEPEIETEP